MQKTMPRNDYIEVPTATYYSSVTRYSNCRDFINHIGYKYKQDIAFIIKTKKAERSNPAEYKKITYEQFKNDVHYFGCALYMQGFLNKRMAIISKNRYEWVVGYYAILQGLGIVVPLDKELTYEEFRNSIERSETDAVFFEKSYLDYIIKLHEDEVFKDLKYICMDNINPDVIGFEVLIYDKLIESGEKINLEEEHKFESLNIDPNALSVILFTSGTSGISKAVMLSQNNFLHNCWSTLLVEDIQKGDVNMAFLPFHHTYGSTGMATMLTSGVTNVFCDGLKYIQQNLNEYHVSLFIGVPALIEAIYHRIMREARRQKKDRLFERALDFSDFLMKFNIDIRHTLFKSVIKQLGGKLRYIISGASPLDPVVSRAFNSMGIETIQGYGLTECSPVLASETPLHSKPGTIGRAIPNVKLRIDNPDADGVGELIAKGENVMLGYYNDPKATRECLVDGWFFTGDLAALEDGYLVIKGRKKSVIVLKNGKNVYPEEIEVLISNISYVNECIVYGETANNDPSDCVITARIVYDKEALESCAASSEYKDLYSFVKRDIDHINESLPGYKRIRRLYITTEPMEKTSTGKVKRYLVLKGDR